MRRPVSFFPVWFLAVVGLVLLAGTARPFHKPTHRRMAEHSAVATISPRLAPIPSRVESGVGLIFSHIGDGEVPASDQLLQTIVVLTNNTERATEGFLEFYDDGGNPLTLQLDGETGSRFPFNMTGRETRRFVTDGVGSLKQGWLFVLADQALVGSLSFGVRDTAGHIYTDVGVAASPLGTEFTIFGDTIGLSDTGIAVANPDLTQSIEIEYQLIARDGRFLQSATREIPPSGHLALFLSELFPSVEGINDFEGTIVLSCAEEFAGISLRTTGNVFTSMPMIPAPPEGADWDRLTFPHLGDGRGGGLEIRTSIVLINNSAEPAKGQVDFWASDATPLALSVEGEITTLVEFDLLPGAVIRLTTEAAQGIRQGWARVSTDQPIDGTALFSISDRTGRLLTEVGVPAALLYRRFNLIADTQDIFDSGIAIVNPLLESAPIDVEFTLHNQWGSYQGFARETLFPRQHQAFFLTELFPDVAEIDEFQGRLEVSSSGWVAPMCLRQAGVNLTSAPTLLKTYGFSPLTELDFVHEVAGTAPAFEWWISQRSGDYTIRKLVLSSPEVGVDFSTIQEGDRFGLGYTAKGSSSLVLDIIATNTETRQFRVLAKDHEGHHSYADGMLLGDLDGGFSFELQFSGGELPPVLSSDVFLTLHFPPDLLILPEPSDPIDFEFHFVSAPHPAAGSPGIIRRTIQTLHLSAPFESAPMVASVEPFYLAGEELAILKGANFGTDPTVVFETALSRRVSVRPLAVSDSELEVVVPGEIFAYEGELWVDTSQGRSNRLRMMTWFNPMIRIVQEGDLGLGPSEWGFQILQSGEELLAQEFELQLPGADVDFTELSLEQVVGQTIDPWRYPGGRSIVARVVEDERAEFAVVDSYLPEEPRGTLIVERVSEDWAGLAITYRPTQFPAGPDVRGGFTWEWRLTGLPLVFAEAQGARIAWGRIYSAPHGASSGRGSSWDTTDTVVYVNR